MTGQSEQVQKERDPWNIHKLSMVSDFNATSVVGDWHGDESLFETKEKSGIIKGYTLWAESETFYGINIALYSGLYINDARKLQIGGYAYRHLAE
jgi:hypothetical protein